MREFSYILFGDGCRQRCGDTLLCGDIPYRVNEMNASLAAINSKEDGFQLSRALRSAAKQWRHGGLIGHQLGNPRIFLWEQSEKRTDCVFGLGCVRADTAREIAGRGLTRYKNRAAFITADSLVL